MSVAFRFLDGVSRQSGKSAWWCTLPDKYTHLFVLNFFIFVLFYLTYFYLLNIQSLPQDDGAVMHYQFSSAKGIY